MNIPLADDFKSIDLFSWVVYIYVRNHYLTQMKGEHYEKIR